MPINYKNEIKLLREEILLRMIKNKL